MEQQTVAERIVTSLQELGVSHVFGVPGGAIEPLYNAMSKWMDTGGPTPVHTRHESAAAFMAHGASLINGRLSACCATTGPGATNLITGVAAAYADHVPMIVITGQNAISKLGRPALQDSSEHGVDTVSIFRSLTKYSALVPHASALQAIFTKAIAHAMTPPFGPVHLSVPTDVLNSLAPVWSNEMRLPAPCAPSGTLQGSLLQALHSPRLCLHIGRRARHLGGRLEQLISTLNIPYVTSAQGKSALNSHLPQCAGVFGFCGHESAQHVVRNAETILSIGGNMEELSMNGWSPELCNTTVHCISDDPDDLMRALGLCHTHHERPEDVIDYLLQHGVAQHWYNVQNPYPHARSQASETSKNHPGVLLEALFQVLPSDANMFIDAGNSWCWYLHYVSCTKAFIEANFGAMGWAIGAAIGAAFASPSQLSVVVTGDGSFLMHGNELSTAVERQASVLFVVMNDGGLGMVRHGQQMSGSASLCHAFPSTSYTQLAMAMGCRACRVIDAADIQALSVGDLAKSGGPYLIELMVEPSIPPPMGKRIASLQK